MDSQDVYTIELNLDDDFSRSTAYHVDSQKNTFLRNIRHAETGKKTNRWVLVGLANSHPEALDKTWELQKLLCERNNRKPKSLELSYADYIEKESE